MKPGEILLLIAAGALILTFTSGSYINILKTFLPSVEGYSPAPYWDYKQWSWGYGTKVPGSTNSPATKPTGTINRADALAAAVQHIQNDKNYLDTLITRQLSGKQWAALLSFSYNLGPDDADNLVSNINAGNDTALKNQWLQYVNAGGQYNQALYDRRLKEWQIWSS